MFGKAILGVKSIPAFFVVAEKHENLNSRFLKIFNMSFQVYPEVKEFLKEVKKSSSFKFQQMLKLVGSLR